MANVFMGTTKIDPHKTISEITSLLVRAKALQVMTDYANGRVIAVSFALQVPNVPSPVNFRLPCRMDRMLKLLHNRDQAERTAWRQVLRWVEAQLAMIDVGMVQPHEVFQPYAMIPGTDKTMFQAWEQALINDSGRLIAAPKEDSNGITT